MSFSRIVAVAAGLVALGIVVLVAYNWSNSVVPQGGKLDPSAPPVESDAADLFRSFVMDERAAIERTAHAPLIVHGSATYLAPGITEKWGWIVFDLNDAKAEMVCSIEADRQTATAAYFNNTRREVTVECQLLGFNRRGEKTVLRLTNGRVKP